MSQRVPVNRGSVDWSGENPGIYLKTDPEGDWSALGIFFRVVLSPHGRGSTVIVLERPDERAGYPDVNNLCLTDNAELTRYLVDNYVAKFPSFRDKPGLAGMARLPLDEVETGGDMRSAYREIMRGGGVEVAMEWRDLSEPFAVEVTPKDSATGEHDMYSVFLEATDASILVDGRAFAGQVTDRLFFGKTMSTAFVALSEIWVKPNEQP